MNIKKVILAWLTYNDYNNQEPLHLFVDYKNKKYNVNLNSKELTLLLKKSTSDIIILPVVDNYQQKNFNIHLNLKNITNVKNIKKGLSFESDTKTILKLYYQKENENNE